MGRAGVLGWARFVVCGVTIAACSTSDPSGTSPDTGRGRVAEEANAGASGRGTVDARGDGGSGGEASDERGSRGVGEDTDAAGPAGSGGETTGARGGSGGGDFRPIPDGGSATDVGADGTSDPGSADASSDASATEAPPLTLELPNGARCGTSSDCVSGICCAPVAGAAVSYGPFSCTASLAACAAVFPSAPPAVLCTGASECNKAYPGSIGHLSCVHPQGWQDYFKFCSINPN